MFGPIPDLSEIGVPITGPIPEGPPDLIPGLLPQRGQLVIAGATNIGKAQPLDAKVLTPAGWKLMGELRVGDALASPDGATSTVTAIFPKGVRQVYKVTFTDGRSTEACAEHLWEVSYPGWSRKGGSGIKLLTTQEAAVLSKGMRRRVCIPVPEDLEYGATAEMPIDPWLMGVLLGDGSVSCNQTQFTTADAFIATKVKEIVELYDELTVNKLQDKYGYSIASQWHGDENTLKNRLKKLGVMGCRSYEKFIPDCYLTATRQVREQLIVGLLDTDGYINATGCIIYTTTSPKLAEQVAYLVRSIGGVCSIRLKRAPFYRDKQGVKHFCKDAYNLYIMHHNPRSLVSLPRKSARLPEVRRKRLLKFASIVPSRMAETQCISVSHPRGLYITDNFVVTHNTLLALEFTSALITGNPLWGELVPSNMANKVMYVLGEHYVEQLQRQYRKTKLPMTADVRVLGPEELKFDKWLVTQGRINTPSLEKYKRWAEGVDLIVFDPLSAFISGVDAENDNIQMRLLIQTMSDLAHEAGASCLILAHKGKPSMEGAKEYSRHSYAIRGASAIEDAATNIFYMEQGENDPSQKAAGGSIYELRKRKYKGDAPDVFRLMRDPVTLTHTMLGGRPYSEVLKMEAQAKIARIQAGNTSIDFRTAVKLVADIEGVALETMYRRLGIKG